ncbi:MAG: glucose-1-phosphate adenylyltransferase [Thermodesulfobacteriota bacterium]|nr:glucose-1-phosphate adenylyltransferase [Thermodesulfobacteriota bacterium]
MWKKTAEDTEKGCTMNNVLAFIMAGGRGERLGPLTLDRTKPAVPFGGIYRLIDFTLSNCINSQIFKIVVLPQYKSQSLIEHLESGWNIFGREIGNFLRIIPPQQRTGSDWYRGTADSIRQNLYLIERLNPLYVLVLSGDHIYKMDYRLFIRYHEEKKADITISLLEVDVEFAHQFGVAEVDDDFQIKSFQEKPTADVKTIPGDSENILASMGIYLFRTETLVDILKKSDGDDFGRDIIPQFLGRKRVYAYPYRKFNRIQDYTTLTLEDHIRKSILTPRTRDSEYWRDVGTLDQYWLANMDLTGVDPYFNLYGQKWPIHTYQIPAPPAKFVFATESEDEFRVGKALDSIVAPGCIVCGIVQNSVLSYNVVVRSWSTVEESIILDDVVIGRYCKIKKAIIDKDNMIPPYTEIGCNHDMDSEHFKITPGGVVVVPKGYFRNEK